MSGVYLVAHFHLLSHPQKQSSIGRGDTQCGGGWVGRQVVDQIKCPCTLITFCWSGRNGLGYYATICYSEQITSLRPTAT